MAGLAKTILVFGDSLTWGFVPAKPMFPTSRHAYQDRWPSILKAGLGSGYDVIAEGLNARTTNIDDPENPHRNGAAYLPAAILSHQPLDLIIIMLGSNDTKDHLNRQSGEIGQGMAELLKIAGTMGDERLAGCSPCPVLVISPPPFGSSFAPEIAHNFKNAPAKRQALAGHYQAAAAAAGASFLDAGTVIPAELVGPDGLHLTVEANRQLGKAAAAKVKEIIG